ncbi:MAG: hypothetical protein ACI9K5_002517 [Gammaproteobacteria bacterium]|jgi:hypothetical protein
MRIPRRMREKLRSAPRTGGGVHRWLFSMSLPLHRYLKPDEIEILLSASVRNCGRDVPAGEINDAVVNSLSIFRGGRSKRSSSGGGKGLGKGKAVSTAPMKWPGVDHERRAQIIASSTVTLDTLRGASPMPIDPGENVNLYLYLLFDPEHLLCIGRSQRDFRTLPCSSLLDMIFENICLIVPSPMTSKYGRTKGGKRSQHTLSNTGPRRYLVTEFDSGTFDEQAKIILHLKDSMPLVMILCSAGKSLHAWWTCEGHSEGQLLEFFRYAVSLGADRAIWSPAQFVRLPQGWRKDRGATQAVHYFDMACLPGREDKTCSEEGQQ